MPEQSVHPSPSAQVTAAEISRIAGVTRATVSNWRRRHDDFPAPDGGTESSPLYDLQAVQTWLRKRGQTSAASPVEELRTALRLHASGAAERLFPLVPAVAQYGSDAQAGLDSLPDDELLARASDALGRLPDSGPSAGSAVPYGPEDAAAVRALVRCVREAGPQAAVDAIAERELDESAATGTYRTPEALAVLMAGLLPAGTVTVLDPACGSGTLLVAAARQGATRLYGQDVLPVQVQRAAVQLLLTAITTTQAVSAGSDAAAPTAAAPGAHADADADADAVADAGAQARPVVRPPEGSVRIEAGDSLRADAFPGLTVDAVLCNPPFGDRDWGHDELAYDPRWAYGVPPRSESELAWVQHALAHVGPGGHVVMLLPPALAFRASGRRIRAELVRSGALRAVVSLPAGAAQPLHIGLQIWVLQRPQPGSAERASVLFVNGESGQQEAAGGTHSTLGALSTATRGPRGATRSHQAPFDWADVTGRVVAQWSAFAASPDTFTDEPGLARAVPVVDLLGDVVDLTPARHVRATAADIGPEALARRVTELHGELAEQVRTLSAVSAYEEGAWGPSPAGESTESWRTATVADLARGGALTLLRGVLPGARDTAGGSSAASRTGSQAGHPVLTAGDVSAGSPPSGTADGLRTETTHLVASGDVVLRGDASQGARGAMTRVAEDQDAGSLLGPHLHLLRPDPARLDPWFLAGFLGADDNIAVASTGSTIVHVNPGRLRVPLLPLAEQQRYGEAFRRVHELRTAARRTADVAAETATALAAGLTSGGLVPPATGRSSTS